MIPGAFMDLHAVPGDDLPFRVAAGAALRIIHGASARTGVRFAIAFPGYGADRPGAGATPLDGDRKIIGSKLRVFASGTDALQVLMASDGALARLKAFCVAGTVLPVDPAAVRGHEAYILRRLPSGISKKRKSISEDRQREMREAHRAKLKARQRGLPFLPMRSSGGAVFSLTFERVSVTPGEAEAMRDGEANGYGLSRSESIVALPVF